MSKNVKKMAWMLSISMLASMTPMLQTAHAAAVPTNVVLKGRYETNIPIKVEYQADGAATFQWEISDNGTTGWTPIANATTATYTPNKEQGLKWVRAAVTAGGTTVNSPAKQLNERWYGKLPGVADGKSGSLGCDSNAVIYALKPNAYRAETNVNDVFTLDNDEYILLDTSEDDNSRFLVMKKKAIGTHTVSNGSQRMEDVMCWLNDKASLEIFANNASRGIFPGKTDYSKADGYRADMKAATKAYAPISDTIMKHVDENATWKQEEKMWEWGNCEITYSGGLTIPSMTDYEKYVDKIGWRDFTTANTGKMMAFRTGHGNGIPGGHFTSTYNVDWGMGTTYANEADRDPYAIRPMFFLKNDFFLDPAVVKQMDFTKIGENIKLTIANAYPLSQLVAAGYKESDIKPYENRTGALSEVTMDGIFETSLPITLKYTYEGSENRLKFNLYASDTENGQYTKIGTQIGNKEYPLPITVDGKYVKFSVETTDNIIKWTNSHYVKNSLWGRDPGVHPENIGKELPCTDGSKVLMKPLNIINQTTPKENVFNIDGSDFIMLDVTESDASKFFVMSKHIVDGAPVTFTDGGQLMDKMMDFLNSTNGVLGYMPIMNADGTFAYNGRVDNLGNPLDSIFPIEILKNINYNQTWKVERKMWEDIYERTVKGGISFPAMHEIRQYSDKIGLWDNKVAWWTRTPLGANTGGGDTTLYANETNLGMFAPSITRVGFEAHIRPVFYLDKSMFTDKVYDLSTFQVGVLAAIRKAYTRNELAAAGYSEAVLKQYYDVSGDLTSARIDGIYETSLPVKADFVYTGNNLANIKINWYVSDTVDGIYSLIGSVSGEKNDFRIPYDAANKFIKAEVVCIPTEKKIFTEARQVGTLWGPQVTINENTAATVGPDGKIHGEHEIYEYNPITQPKETPAQYTFKYNNVDYILLDTTESNESHYLVMTKTPTFKHAFNKDANGGQTFNDLIGWLNDLDTVESFAEGKKITTATGYAATGLSSTADALPKAITDHINKNNNWKVERKTWDDKYERAYTGGIAVPSYKELERYANKIGSYDGGHSDMWLRTPEGKRPSDGNSVMGTGTVNEFSGCLYSNPIKTVKYIRPIFYLDKNFFTSVRVEAIGSDTKALITKDVPKEAMLASGLYTAAEVEELYKAPVEPDYIKATFANVETGGDVVATFTTNIPGDGLMWVFIVAVYDKDGRLLGVNYDSQSSVIDPVTKKYTLNVTVPTIAAGVGNYAKGFVWDNDVASMYPLTAVIQ